MQILKSASNPGLMRYAKMLGFGDIHFKIDAKTGLTAIVAIHSIARGPAIGGCRFYEYTSIDLALKDVLRLAYMMTLKAAASDLPHGGAKSVIIKPAVIKDRDALFQTFGDFVNQLGGRYITAMDVGTTTTDMDSIAKRTPFVIGASSTDSLQGDPSPFTATGIFRGIEACVQFQRGDRSVKGLTVAIQGGGKVGYHLAKHLHEHGAKIAVCDTKPENLDIFKKEFNAQIVSLDAIYDVPCDIFSPCAMGGVLNLETIQRLKTKIIAGCANNQLAHRKFGQLLREKGIVYAPDFVINSGGLIQAASVHDYHDINIANRLVDRIYDRILSLLERAKRENLPTTDVAEQIAIEKLQPQNLNSHTECA